MVDVGDMVCFSYNKQSNDVGEVIEVAGDKCSVKWEVSGRVVHNYGPGEVRIARANEVTQRRAMRTPEYWRKVHDRVAKLCQERTIVA